MSALAVTRTSLRRMLRDRTAMFFVVVLPIMVILVVGLAVSGSNAARVGVVDLAPASPINQELRTSLSASPALKVRRYGTEASLRTAVRRGEVAAGLVLPADLDSNLRAGNDATVILVADTTSSDQQAARTALLSVVSQDGARMQAAAFATQQAGGSFDANLARVDAVMAGTSRVRVETSVVGTNRRFLPRGFGDSVPTMLVLFVFINASASGALLIDTRRLGVYHRMAAAPVRPRSILLGETGCYFLLALLQSLLIVAVGTFVFRVTWGSAPAAAALVLLWVLVGTGAGMLSGALFKTPEQASSIAPPTGIALGMLGGCMWPLAIVGSVMKTIGHITPHAWAVDGWITVISRHGSIAKILPNLGVLAGFATVFLVTANLRLRRRLFA